MSPFLQVVLKPICHTGTEDKPNELCTSTLGDMPTVHFTSNYTHKSAEFCIYSAQDSQNCCAACHENICDVSAAHLNPVHRTSAQQLAYENVKRS